MVCSGGMGVLGRVWIVGLSDALVPLSHVESWIVEKVRCECGERDTREDERREEERMEEEEEERGETNREPGVQLRETLYDVSTRHIRASGVSDEGMCLSA